MTVLSQAGDETISQDFESVSVNASEFLHECKYTNFDFVNVYCRLCFVQFLNRFINRKPN